MDLLDVYFKSNRYFITKHHLDSFNEFTSSTIPKVIANMNPFPILKNDAADKPNHDINIYVGGIDGNKIRFKEPESFAYPNECRLMNKTYGVELRADILIRYKNAKDTGTDDYIDVVFEDIFLCHVPVMLHSNLCVLHDKTNADLTTMGECIYDQGGYFIVDGKEKVVIAQESNVTNRLYTSVLEKHAKNYTHSATIRCTSLGSSVFPKTFVMFVDKHQRIVVAMPHISLDDVPVCALFRALGVESDKNILLHIDALASDAASNFFRPSIVHGHAWQKGGALNQLVALEEFKAGAEHNSIEHVMYIFFEHLFPNVPGTLADKAKFLGRLVNELIGVAMGTRAATDRDNYMQKRVNISGALLGDIFKDFYNDFRVKTRSKIDNDYNNLAMASYSLSDVSKTLVNKFNVKDIFNKSDKFTFGIIKSLKGNWGMREDKAKSGSEQGTVQDLSRISYIGFVSHMRRVNTPLDAAVKLRKPHQLWTTQYGYMCPCESPDGASIGLLKNMAVLAQISYSVDPGEILELLLGAGFCIVKTSDINLNLMKDLIRIHFNNNWFGCLDSTNKQNGGPDQLVRFIRTLRRCGLINSMVSVSWNVIDASINILCDAGRVCRPLLHRLPLNPLKSQKHRPSWDELCGINSKYDLQSIINDDLENTMLSMMSTSKGCIEYIDVEESNTCLIAMDQKEFASGGSGSSGGRFTHCELHPSTMFSAYTSTIPLPHHNQAPRNIFSGAQGKQAIGVYATNFNYRIDTMSLILHYPQRALVGTQYMEYLNVNKLPNGENLIVGIGSYSGYNQEDSIIVKKESVERGMFNLTYYHAHVTEEEASDTMSSTFGNPNTLAEEQAKDMSRFDTIDANGMPILNQYIADGDCIVGKIEKTTRVEVLGDPSKDVYLEKKNIISSRGTGDFADKTLSGFVDRVAVFPSSEDPTLHKAKIRLRSFRIPDLGDKLACYSEDTDILTGQRGWIKWSQLTLSDTVASAMLDANADASASYNGLELQYVHPIALHKYFHDGDMVHFKTDEVDICVTENHNMMIQYELDDDIVDNEYEFNEFVEFKKTNVTGFRFEMAADLLANKVSFNITDKIEISQTEKKEFINDKIAIYGIWLRHGIVTANANFIHFASTAKPFVEVHLNDGSKAFPLSKKQNNGSFMIPKTTGQFFDVTSKNQLDPIVWSFSILQCQVLLYSIMNQGKQVDQREIDISIDDIQRLALHAGLSSRIVGTFIEIYEQDNYRVTSSDVTLEKYQGYVFCCSVPPNNNVLVRRNGKVAWCGNSRHGQKGVIGMIMPHHEMPFTRDGLVPDIIINPHAFPSRMTVGHLIECVLAKLGVEKGVYTDATAFGQAENIKGFEKRGDEVMYNGKTGEQMRCDIFIGPTYYFRLKHMVEDKINYRERGQMVGITQQPTQGRGHGGGLRIGEMETAALLAYGISAFTKESLMERSDAHQVAFAGETGCMIPYNRHKRIIDSCNPKHAKIPFAFKTLLHELQGLSIQPMMRFKEGEDAEEADDCFWGEEDNEIDGENDAFSFV